MQKTGRWVIILVVFLGAASAAAWYSGRSAGRREMMIEAVQQNHGHYKIIDNLGNTSFEWGPSAK